MANGIKIGPEWKKTSKKNFEYLEIDMYNGGGMHYANKVTAVPVAQGGHVLRITWLYGTRGKEKKYTRTPVLVFGVSKAQIKEYCTRITEVLRMDDASDQTEAQIKSTTRLVKKIIKAGEFYVRPSSL